MKTRERADKADTKQEKSKALVDISDRLAYLTTAGTFAAVFILQDTSPLAYLIPGVFGLATVARGYYFWKAKAENLKKFGQADKITMDSEGGIQ